MKELVEDEDFYFNESGLMVFLEKYHLQRGDCCGKGCKHCPFNYSSVAEPKRNELLSLRNDEKIKK
jgi:hypothetical protein